MSSDERLEQRQQQNEAAMSAMVSRDGLASALKISSATVSSFATTGLFKPVKGMYPLVECLTAYYEKKLKDASGKSEEKKEAAQRLMTAKADIEEMKARTMRSELMERSEMEEQCMGILAAASAELMSVPDDIAGQGAGMSERPLRNIAANRINTALENLKSNLEEMSRER